MSKKHRHIFLNNTSTITAGVLSFLKNNIKFKIQKSITYLIETKSLIIRTIRQKFMLFYIDLNGK